MISIRACSVAEIESASSFKDLLAEYAGESAIEGLPPPSARMPFYYALEKTGAFSVYGAFEEEDLIGFITVLTSVLPHYSTTVAVTESFFVASQHRDTGAGLKLLREAEDYAKERGSPGLLVAAPAGGSLAMVLPGIGYVETTRAFFRKFGNE